MRKRDESNQMGSIQRVKSTKDTEKWKKKQELAVHMPKQQPLTSHTKVFSWDMTHTYSGLTERQVLADAHKTLVICRMLVYLWRGQLPQGRGKGGSLAIPACNKQYK